MSYTPGNEIFGLRPRGLKNPNLRSYAIVWFVAGVFKCSRQQKTMAARKVRKIGVQGAGQRTVEKVETVFGFCFCPFQISMGSLIQFQVCSSSCWRMQRSSIYLHVEIQVDIGPPQPANSRRKIPWSQTSSHQPAVAFDERGGTSLDAVSLVGVANRPAPGEQ